MPRTGLSGNKSSTTSSSVHHDHEAVRTGRHHVPTSPHQKFVITITSRQCSSDSVVPCTSGSSTFWPSTSSCPSQPTVTSWMTRDGTCAAPQSAGRATEALPPITYPLSCQALALPVRSTIQDQRFGAPRPISRRLPQTLSKLRQSTRSRTRHTLALRL